MVCWTAFSEFLCGSSCLSGNSSKSFRDFKYTSQWASHTISCGVLSDCTSPLRQCHTWGSFSKPFLFWVSLFFWFSNFFTCRILYNCQLLLCSSPSLVVLDYPSHCLTLEFVQCYSFVPYQKLKSRLKISRSFAFGKATGVWILKYKQKKTILELSRKFGSILGLMFEDNVYASVLKGVTF